MILRICINIIKKLLVSFSAVLVTLAILELIITILKLSPAIFELNVGGHRFSDNPRICYELAPNQTTWDMPDKNERINSHGFRGRECGRYKKNNTRRIVMLGDSITFGLGLPLQSTFPVKLERLLNRHKKTDINYEVLNFGVPGYNIINEAELFKEKAIGFSPDIVVLNYFMNDTDMSLKQIWSDYLKGCPSKNAVRRYYSQKIFLLKRLLYKSKLYTFLVNRINYSAGRYVVRDSITDPIKEGLTEISNLMGRGAFKVIIFVHPCLSDNFNAGYDYNHLKDIASGYGIKVIDLLPCYRKVSNSGILFRLNHNDLGHPNDLGTSVIAKEMFRALIRLGYI